MTSLGNWSLRGNTNQEAQKAGTNHGSHTMVREPDSIKMPACPMDVAFIAI